MDNRSVRVRLLYKVMRVASWLVRGPFTAGSCALVLRDPAEILLVQNRGRGGEWGLPGGFWKRNETPEAGLRRELEEEIGLAGAYFVSPVDQYRQDWAPHLDFLYSVRAPVDFLPERRDQRRFARSVGSPWTRCRRSCPKLTSLCKGLAVMERFRDRSEKSHASDFRPPRGSVRPSWNERCGHDPPVFVVRDVAVPLPPRIERGGPVIDFVASPKA